MRETLHGVGVVGGAPLRVHPWRLRVLQVAVSKPGQYRSFPLYGGEGGRGKKGRRFPGVDFRGKVQK